MRMTASDISIASVFRRKGGEGRMIRLYQNLGRHEQDLLSREVRFGGGEIPVVAYYESDAVWCLLTTERLVRRSQSDSYEVAIMELGRVTHDMHRSVQRGELDRRLWRDLNIATTDGRLLKLELEPGAGFLGFWSVLQWLAGWAAKRRNLAA